MFMLIYVNILILNTILIYSVIKDKWPFIFFISRS